MKKHFSKVSLFTGALLISATTLGQTQNNQIGNTGKVGIGTTTPSSCLEVFNTSALGTGTSGNTVTGVNTLISREGGSTNLSAIKGSIWLRRLSYGTDWTTAAFHNGLSVDGSFQTPGVDTRTWWERTPYSDRQTWGDMGNTYMTLQKGKLGIGNSGEPVELLQLGDRFVFHNGGNKYLGYNMRYNGTNDVRMTNDYASRITFGGGDITMELFPSSAPGTICNPEARGTFKVMNNGNINSETPWGVAAKMSLHSSSNDKGSMFKVTNWSTAGYGFGFDYIGGVMRSGIYDKLNDQTPSLLLGFRRASGDVPQIYIGDVTNTTLTNSNTRLLVSATVSAPNAIDVIDNTTQEVNFRVKNDGKVYAREVNIQTGIFADYVFEDNYKLMPLQQVEKYISEKGHLPGFETAEHYVENGMNTSEMFVKQQEKIEELTLYIIELEKRLNSIEKTQQK